MTKDELISLAKQARERAYIPYSKFGVGAAVLTKSGNVYQGCNIENAAYPVTCCAERTAIFQAIANGEKEFAEIAVVANTERPVPPCGSCRQVMAEFFTPEAVIHISNMHGNSKSITMEELLPFSFQPDDLFSDEGAAK
ncbi:cytidine deaminase [Terribacillus aidingensis]|uniref:Cytidine deaminase n=1 Tax=Terribacillus aidingensis TaxID=586416 RepID=A0A285NRN4_9BACI|nr:cytidine deaminase [Terribacillus aidingensis]SNZ10301.1 cytidine deaminase [Terribacillus aidingensis]